MNPGRLRARLTLQSATRTRRDGGGYTEAWADLATVWGRVEALQGTERQRAMQNGAVNPHRVEIRYRTGVTSAKRALYHHPDGDRVLNISSVYDPEERRKRLLLEADQA